MKEEEVSERERSEECERKVPQRGEVAQPPELWSGVRYVTLCVYRMLLTISIIQEDFTAH